MNKNVFCGQCGTANPKQNNFCYSCGKNLTHSEKSSITPDIHPQISSNDYPEIRDALLRFIQLKDPHDVLTITVQEYLAQFLIYPAENVLRFYIFSNKSLHITDKDPKEFKEFGLTYDSDSGGYYKTFPLSNISIDKIIYEIKLVMEEVCQVDFSSYRIGADFENTTASTNSSNKGCFRIVLASTVFAIFILAYDKCNNDSYHGSSGYSNGTGSSGSTSTVSNQNDSFLAYKYAQKFVKDKLKSPSTAKFPGTFEKVDHITSLGNGRFYIDSWVDSQNGFGATVRSRWTCTIVFDGNEVIAEDLDIE